MLPVTIRTGAHQAWALSFALAAASIVACSGGSSSPQSSGSDAASALPEADADAGPRAADAADAVDTTAAECPLPERLGSPRCEACIKAACCDVIGACADDPACRTVLSCAQACLLDSAASTAGPCIEQCKEATPKGAAKYTTFDDCVAAPSPKGCAYECS